MLIGDECFNKCGGKQGPCDFCGAGRLCCRKNHYDKTKGCDGTFGGQNQHECVHSPSGNIFKTRDNRQEILDLSFPNRSVEQFPKN